MPVGPGGGGQRRPRFGGQAVERNGPLVAVDDDDVVGRRRCLVLDAAPAGPLDRDGHERTAGHCYGAGQKPGSGRSWPPAA